MKKLMILFSLLICGMAQGQKLFVYSQELKSGSTKVFAGEDGKEYHSHNNEVIFYIFLQTSSTPLVRELWIDGSRYEFKMDSVSTPVIMKTGIKFNNHQKSDTLVKKTSDKVYRITPGRKMENTGPKYSKGVTLLLKSKKIKVSQIKELSPAFNQ